MNRPHVHTPECHATCSRQVDLDERSITGAYRIVTRTAYGTRKRDVKPRWWPFAFHAFKAAIQFVVAVLTLWLARACHLGAQ